jgi:hypothetical protein
MREASEPLYFISVNSIFKGGHRYTTPLIGIVLFCIYRIFYLYTACYHLPRKVATGLIYIYAHKM